MIYRIINRRLGRGFFLERIQDMANKMVGEAVRTPGHQPDKPNAMGNIRPVVFHAKTNQNYASKTLEGFKRV